MSDFFEGLAARSSGAATALRPRVGSAYETRDVVEVTEETPALTMREVRAVARPAVASPMDGADPVVEHEAEPAPAETPQAPRATIREVRVEQRVERVREHTHEHTRHEERIQRIRELLTTVPESQAEVREDPPHREAIVPASPVPPRRQAQAVPLLQSRTQHQSSALQRQPPEPDRQAIAPRDATIHVTIGRVEVRAVHPAPLPPRPAPPPTPSGPTLEEFLAQRERRK